MKYIELFSGSGGGILAHNILHGHRLVPVVTSTVFDAIKGLLG